MRKAARDVSFDSLRIIPRGGTALNDAIYRGLSHIKGREDALVVIITDGGENASTEIRDKAKVKERIEKLIDQGVQFQYLSANIDAFEDAASYAIPKMSTQSFAATSTGVTDVYATTRSSSLTYLADPQEVTIGDES
jgi:hypothetical protein